MKAKEQKIFDSVLALVSHEGWIAASFARGVKQAGASVVEARKFFPHGIESIADAFHQSIDEAMQTHIKSKRNFAAMRVREKITFAVRARLQAVEKNRDAMRRLLVWSLLPRNIRKAAQHLWQAADTIWVAAGDTSTDYNYYTKRLLLVAVMKSTLSFWLNDNSPGHCETWEFLDRRIDDVMKLGKGISVIKTVGVSDIVSLLRSRFAA
jgi:ubiquinone biosynthesis protein COQ9